MPPRYAYWTILIDGKATAFRAAEREELQPTFAQLARKNADIAMKYFARGKLWDSPDQAQWAAKSVAPAREQRTKDWRPGGTHQDPRTRFDGKVKKRRSAAALRDSDNRAKDPSAPEESARPPRTDRPASKRPDDRARERPQGDRPPPPRPDARGASRPTGDRPAWKRPDARGDRSQGDRPKWTRPDDRGRERPQGDRPPPPRPDARGASRPAGDRPTWKRPDARGDRPQGDRSQGDRPKWNRPDDRGRERPQGDRPPPRPDTRGASRPAGDRPAWKRPDARSDRPQGDRSQGDRPKWSRPDDRGRERPQGARPPWTRPDDRRPGWKKPEGSDRPRESKGAPDGRPKGVGGDRRPARANPRKTRE